MSELPEPENGLPIRSLPGDDAALRRPDFRAQLGRALRVGGIDYLNSRPLVETFEQIAGEEVELHNAPPSELARRLRSRELDVALVPVAEYLLAPPERDYRIVPGVGIASHGAVESIRLFHRKPLGDVRRVALDRSSMTSVLLTRLLFSRRPSLKWRRGDGKTAEPQYERLDVQDGLRRVAEKSPADDAPDAVLLIGDAALRATPTPDWSIIDLGLEWTRWTGMPFVYAFWVFHGEPPEGLVDCFARVARSGFAAIDRIVRRGPLPPGMNFATGLHYLTHVIRFFLGSAEMRGLEEFASQLRANGLLTDSRPLRFIPPSPSPSRLPATVT